MKIEHIILQTQIMDENSAKKLVILYKGEAFTYFDSGLTRHVYVNDSKTKVIKILIDKRSMDYNLEEIEIYKHATDAARKEFAKTELTYDGNVVEQEFCNPIKFDKRKLTIPQMLFASSCRNEVGWNSKNKLVCFDLNEYKRY